MASRQPLPGETNPRSCAFLCGSDGQIIGDTGDGAISARAVVGLIESTAWVTFLDQVRAREHNLGLETRIPCRESANTLLLTGSQTPSGTLVLATLADEEHLTQALFGAIHDLKNPISSIISACEYLEVYSQENLDPEQLQMITEIESSAMILLRLSDRIAELTHSPEASSKADSAF